MYEFAFTAQPRIAHHSRGIWSQYHAWLSDLVNYVLLIHIYPFSVVGLTHNPTLKSDKQQRA